LDLNQLFSAVVDVNQRCIEGHCGKILVNQFVRWAVSAALFFLRFCLPAAKGDVGLAQAMQFRQSIT
jgi:hypothetical protein